jgi:hypothetical protein
MFSRKHGKKHIHRRDTEYAGFISSCLSVSAVQLPVPLTMRVTSVASDGATTSDQEGFAAFSNETGRYGCRSSRLSGQCVLGCLSIDSAYRGWLVASKLPKRHVSAMFLRADSGTLVTAIVSPTALKTPIE